MRPDMSVTDIAFCILKNRGQQIHLKELIAEIMRVKAINQANSGRLIAQIHTEINLDSRFLHHGNGEWGLREWQAKGNKVVKIRPEPSAVPARGHSVLRGDEEEDEDAFGLDEEDEFAAEEAEEELEPDTDDYDDEDDD